MNRSLIADRYAKALFKLAQEQANIEQINTDVRALLKYSTDAEGFIEVLQSPVLKPSQKKEMIYSVLKSQLQPISLNLINLLLDNKRELFIEDICRRFIVLYKSSHLIKEVLLISPIELENSYVDQIKTLLESQFKSPVELTVKIKPELLGGFVLTVDGKMVDASLSSKLKQIKKKLLS